MDHHSGRHDFQIDLALSVVNYGFGLQWDGESDERPKFMRQNHFVPCDYKQTIAKETPKPSPHQEQARKLAQMPKLGNYLPSPEPEPTKKRKICNLSNPPDILKEIKKETKAEPTSWANEVEQQYPLETVQEEEENQQGEQSRFSMEPIFFNSQGKRLNKKERQHD